jgi:general secretion pathway protein B
MSYILEALKKSQQERSRGQVPDLQSLHQSVAMAESAAPRWPYWALGVCLLALAFLLGWLRPWAAPEEVSAASKQSPMPVTADIVEPARVRVVPVQMAEPIKPAMAERPAVTVVPPASRRRDVVQDATPNTTPDISQLPDLLQQSIPQMQFAGHVYSSNPLHRSVIINGHYMSEGDELMPGLRLLQITADSVVFDTQGQRFRVAVLHDWSFQ